RTHAERVAHQGSDGDLSPALQVGRTGLQRDHVLLLELKLRRVLDRDDAVPVRDERREDVERRRLATARAAGDEDIQARLHAPAEELGDPLGPAIVINRSGRNIRAEEADSFIAGLMIMNDMSARVLQMEEMKLNLGPAKGKDFCTVIGP